MTISQLPLSYCTNVHAGRSVAEVQSGLDRYTLRVAEQFNAPLAAGLWLASPVVRELQASEGATARFADGLREQGLTCHTLNAFPFGDFHSTRVKEQVYLPDWTQNDRLEYTLSCAEILARLLPDDGTTGSISTVPLGFKGFEPPADFADRCAAQLIQLARGLDELHARTGKLVRLAIEPEPLCVLETTAETLEFFARLRERASDENAVEIVERHLGVCYDVCHQSVEFEDVAESIAALAGANVRINKVHITCAIELASPSKHPEGREALSRYVEPRYLHQTFARTRDGRILRLVDLSTKLARQPPSDYAEAECWRVHFHVPVDAEELGPLRTTRGDLRRALAEVAWLDYAPHLEVETYTWEVLPGREPDLVTGLTRELVATRQLLGEVLDSHGGS